MMWIGPPVCGSCVSNSNPVFDFMWLGRAPKVPFRKRLPYKDRADRAKYDVRIGKGKADTYGDYRKVLERPDTEVGIRSVRTT